MSPKPAFFIFGRNFSAALPFWLRVELKSPATTTGRPCASLGTTLSSCFHCLFRTRLLAVSRCTLAKKNLLPVDRCLNLAQAISRGPSALLSCARQRTTPALSRRTVWAL